MKYDFLRLAGKVKESIVDGPGIRYVVFTQGCPHKCIGCHNPQTHDLNSGDFYSIFDIVKEIENNPILKGITISGGEPFLQAKQVSNLISKIDKTKLDVFAYTGFLFEDLLRLSNSNNGYLELLSKIDVLLDGKFDINLKTDSLPFRGSKNQRAIDCKKSLETGQIVLYNFN